MREPTYVTMTDEERDALCPRCRAVAIAYESLLDGSLKQPENDQEMIADLRLGLQVIHDGARSDEAAYIAELDAQRAEIARLRGIAAAARSIARGDDPEIDWRSLRDLARDSGFPFWALACDAVAKALEKPK